MQFVMLTFMTKGVCMYMFDGTEREMRSDIS